MRQAIGDSEYETFLGLNLLETGAEAARALECSPAASPSKPMFATFPPIVGSRLGGLNDESLGCLANFARQHLKFVQLVSTGPFDPDSLDHSEFIEVAEDRLRVFNCLNDEELRQMQESAAASLLE